MKSMENSEDLKSMEFITTYGERLNYQPNPTLIQRRHFFGLCPVSFEILNAPKICSGCLSIGYFSKEDQKKDWKEHKSTCKILQTIVKSGKPGEHPLTEDPAVRSKELQMLLSNTFGRSLQQDESDMFNYPRLCSICLDGKQNSMVTCSDCHCAVYCSDVHLEEDKEEHLKSCSQLKICLEDYREERIYLNHPSDSYLPRFARFGYEPLPPEGIIKLLEPELTNMLFHSKTRIFPEIRYTSFRYTCPLSILYGLQTSVPDLSMKDNLVIEIVGARIAETNDLTKWEIIPLRLPTLMSITFVFIGPEIEVDVETPTIQGSSEYLKTCRPNLNQNFHFYKMDYEEFYNKKGKSCPLPDLVAVLNCGFVFYSSWDASIPLMISRGSSLLFTEYYLEDAEFNLEKIEELWEEELNIIMEPQANPFSSMLPARIPTGFNFRKFKRRNFVMSNDCICIISKK
ncbi:uncharacterized protein [Lepeophtheirus salmonis]|uniref:uncharacterized protein n=1 Tax=Lepeophtheirus salmonis TaxID=72036 RepID=UPI001AE6F680|nr:uncharacterized protein LOC121115244 [Lepeophtheirus salmonis]